MEGLKKIILVAIVVMGMFGAGIMIGHRIPTPTPTVTPTPTPTPVYMDAKIAGIHTDKESYRPGDTAIGTVTVQNTGTAVIDKVTLRIKTTNKDYAWLPGERASTMFDVNFTDQSIQPNENKELTFTVNIPETVSGVSTAGTYEIECKLIVNSITYDSVQTTMRVE